MYIHLFQHATKQLGVCVFGDTNYCIGVFFLSHIQVAKLSGDILSEEQCWDFIGTHMAPLAATQLHRPSDREASSGVIHDFFEDLAAQVTALPKHKVNGYIVYVLHEVVTIDLILSDIAMSGSRCSYTHKPGDVCCSQAKGSF